MLSATADRDSLAPIFVLSGLGILLLFFACYECGRRFLRWRRLLGRRRQDAVLAAAEAAVSRRDVHQDTSDDSSKNARKKRIAPNSFVTSRAVSASSSSSSVGPPSVFVDASKEEERSLEESGHTAESSGGEEDGPPSSATSDSIINATPMVDEGSRLVLESTGWAVDACAICMEPYEEGDRISYSKNQTCEHAFHEECIESWTRDGNDCPCCRCPYV